MNIKLVAIIFVALMVVGGGSYAMGVSQGKADTKSAEAASMMKQKEEATALMKKEQAADAMKRDEAAMAAKTDAMKKLDATSPAQ